MHFTCLWLAHLRVNHPLHAVERILFVVSDAETPSAVSDLAGELVAGDLIAGSTDVSPADLWHFVQMTGKSGSGTCRMTFGLAFGLLLFHHPHCEHLACSVARWPSRLYVCTWQTKQMRGISGMLTLSRQPTHVKCVPKCKRRKKMSQGGRPWTTRLTCEMRPKIYFCGKPTDLLGHRVDYQEIGWPSMRDMSSAFVFNSSFCVFDHAVLNAIRRGMN